MLASFLITFREGLEAFLIVGIILSYLAKLDARKFNKYIYMGVFLGVITSLFIAYVFQIVLYGMDDKLYQHYMMIFILLFATVVLSYMVVWMQKQAKEVSSGIKDNLEKLVSAGSIFGMVFLAFLAVIREGFETILFFSALSVSMEESFSMEEGLIGAGLGLVLSIVLVYFMMKKAKKIPLKEFFKYTGLLILIIAAGLFGSAISMMQAAELVPVLLEKVYDISFILDDRGVFGTFLRALFGYNSSPSLIHFVSWAIFLSLSLTFWKRSYAKA